jgi:hypothetical protein
MEEEEAPTLTTSPPISPQVSAKIQEPVEQDTAYPNHLPEIVINSNQHARTDIHGAHKVAHHALINDPSYPRHLAVQPDDSQRTHLLSGYDLQHTTLRRHNQTLRGEFMIYFIFLTLKELLQSSRRARGDRSTNPLLTIRPHPPPPGKQIHQLANLAMPLEHRPKAPARSGLDEKDRQDSAFPLPPSEQLKRMLAQHLAERDRNRPKLLGAFRYVFPSVISQRKILMWCLIRCIRNA